MIEPHGGGRGSLRVAHGVAVAGVVVVAAVVTWLVFAFVAAIVAKVVEVAIAVAVIALAVHFVRRLAHRSGSSGQRY